MEGYGVETPQGLVQAPNGLLTRPTVNRYLSLWHLDQPHPTREPAAVRFQAAHSNDCWQFDITWSDLKHLEHPQWIDPTKGAPTLAIFSVVDDRSGTAYQEYRCIYGEDVESALRFLFNAMAPKADAGYPAMSGFHFVLATECRYPTVLAAKLAIAAELATPLAKLSSEDRAFTRASESNG